MAWLPPMRPSDDGLQALVGNDVQQLERRAGGMGFALLPLAHRRRRRMQVQREHRLAELQGFAQAFDVGRVELPHRRRANRVELAHRHLADGSRFVERFQVAAQRFNDLAHNAPPLKRPTATPSTRLRRQFQEHPAGDGYTFQYSAVEPVATTVAQTHVIFNNNYEDPGAAQRADVDDDSGRGCDPALTMT